MGSVPTVRYRGRGRSSAEQVGRHIHADRFKSDFGDQRPEVLCGQPTAGRGGDPEGVRRRPGPKQNASRLVQIHVDVPVQPCWHATLVWSAIFRKVARQGDPPTPIDLLESVPDLQARKILQSNWAECEHGDHETVTHSSGAGKVVPRKS